MTGPLRSFRHRQLTDLSRVRRIKTIPKSYQYVGGFKFLFTWLPAQLFPAKYLHVWTVIEFKLTQAGGLQGCGHYAITWRRKLSIFNLEVSYAIRNDYKQVEKFKNTLKKE